MTSASTGGTATVNEVTERALLAFPEESIIVIVQFEYVPSLKVLKVMVLFPIIAEVVLEEHEPSKYSDPDSVDENV